MSHAQEEGGLIYDPAAFTPESQEAIAAYLAVVQRQQAAAGASRNDG